MREALLHFVWRTRRFDVRQLYTTQEQTVGIVQFGQFNHNAGPDFLNAHIRIDQTLWVGNVEMHLKSSDWYRHKHEGDPAYANVILHVVFEDDLPVLRKEGGRIPCLELKPLIPKELIANYQKLEYSSDWIPCEKFIPKIDSITRFTFLDRLAVERLEYKTLNIQKLLEENKGNWEETYFQLLSRHLARNINADPMQELAQRTPLLLLSKHRDNLLQLEALLLGQAGFLNDSFDEGYPLKLVKEYRHFSHKYKLKCMRQIQWKFLRMRPANFPTIRIAQLARLIHQTNYLWGKTLAAESIEEVENMLDLEISNYWLTHYHFGKKSEKKRKGLGRDTIRSIIINAICPLLFLYGKERGKPELKIRALKLLEELPAESNRIIRKWKEVGIYAESAYQSQALLHLKRDYCDKRQCLRCTFGNVILKDGG